MGVFAYPYFLMVFWLRDVIFGSIILSKDILVFWLNLVSVPVLIKSFFKPLKNEYHEGLVLFSIITGIITKTILLITIFSITLVLATLLVIFVFFVAITPLIIIRMLAW